MNILTTPNMIGFLLKIYTWLFARPQFKGINEMITKLGLKGLGILYSHDHNTNGELFFLKRILKRYTIESIFDVGANNGNYAKLCIGEGFRSILYCFEPHPVTFEKLSNSLHAPNIQIYNLGFSNLDGQATIYDHESEDGSEHASLFKDVIEIIHHDKVVEHRIQLRTIDSFVHENKIQKIDLLKIDTEGNELNVLLGAKETLKEGKIDIIHFEFNDMNMISKVFMRDFIHVLNDFNVYRLLPKGLLKLDYEKPILMELFSYQNIVAIRKEIDQR